MNTVIKIYECLWTLNVSLINKNIEMINEMKLAVGYCVIWIRIRARILRLRIFIMP